MKKILKGLLVCFALCFFVMLPTKTKATLVSTNEAYTLVNYLNNKVGEPFTDNRCQAFVYQSVGNAIDVWASKACAYEAWQAWGVSSSKDIPLGATVYFSGGSYPCGNHIAGHVGLYVGDGYVVHVAQSKVQKTLVSKIESWSGYSYLGWGWNGGHALAYMPNPPTNVQVATQGTTVTVSWNASNSATSYDVYLIQEPWGWEDVKYSQTSYVLSSTFTNVAPGNYSAFVISRPNADSVQSEWVNFYVNPSPTSPSDVTATVTGSTVSANWSACTYATSYDVYLLQEPCSWEDIKYSQTVYSNSCTFYGVSEGEYFVFVVARPNDNSVQSNWYKIKVYSDVPSAPEIVSDKKITKVNNNITVSWNSIENAEGYSYYLTEFPEGYAYTTNRYADNINETHVTFSDLEPGKYSIFVHAYNSFGRSIQSNWESFYVYENDYLPAYTTNYNGHIYAIYDYEMSWSFARDLCIDMGGHLVTITSSDENDFISKLINAGVKDAYWIGATDFNSENSKYEWVTGEEFEYQNWYKNEPSKSGSDGEKEHFVEIRKSYSNKWNDVNNINKNNKGFIIEIEPSNDYITDIAEYNHNRYLLIDKNTTWTEAKVYCEALGGHLATIENEAEKNFLDEFISSGNRSWYYLGGIKNEGGWSWLNGEDIGHDNWAENADIWKGNYLMKYKEEKTYLPLDNTYYPEKDIKKIGFVCEIELPIPHTETTVTKAENIITADTKVHNISTPYDILIIGYKGDKFVTMKRVPYNEQNSPYTLEGDIDEIKVMVWTDLSLPSPLCKPEEIPVNKWIVN